uniref:non-specific serine/threonine protein kinase n=1 Tax=Brassica oleracea TaxID=3712 RepID=A0A3P6FFG1_BRAOL|nr:unnamed protein product [Brassica oleracea]
MLSLSDADLSSSSLLRLELSHLRLELSHLISDADHELSHLLRFWFQALLSSESRILGIPRIESEVEDVVSKLVKFAEQSRAMKEMFASTSGVFLTNNNLRRRLQNKQQPNEHDVAAAADADTAAAAEGCGNQTNRAIEREAMDIAKAWLSKIKSKGKEKSSKKKKTTTRINVKKEGSKTAEEAVSNATKQKAAAAKQFIENHYKKQLQSQQQRHERRRKLSTCGVRGIKMGTDDFEPLTMIGKGAFGEGEGTGHVYAMKKLKKSEMLRRGQVEHVKAERNLLAEVDSNCIVKLYCSFQDEEYMYLIMDYLPGGDMMTLLMKKRQGFIDIKPDNLLLDRSGHMKLSDFGLCKPLDCSVLEEKDFTYAQNIVTWRNYLKFPEEVRLSPEEAKDLICRLLCNVEQRLGTKRAYEIKDHPWFVGVEWGKLYQMKAGFIPQVNDELDTQNFEKFDEMLSSKDINFVGYTYKNVEILSTNPKRPSIKSLFEDESAGGTTSYQGSFLKHLPPQIQKFQRKSAKRAHHPDDTSLEPDF